MSHTFTRQELYDLVWSEPMRTLVSRFGISDRGMAKACKFANIPVPEVGYWAKVQAGKKVFRRPLPARGLGEHDNVTIGKDRWDEGYTHKEILAKVIPPPPVFETDMESVRQKVIALVNKAPAPKQRLDNTHPFISRLLEVDEARRQKQAASQWPTAYDGPIYQTPFERHRLRILNGLFHCLTFCGIKVSASGKWGRDLSLTVGHQRISISLDSESFERKDDRREYFFSARNEKEKMQLTVRSYRGSIAGSQFWIDDHTGKLEDRLREIATELIVLGEQSHRDGLVYYRQWLIDRKLEAEEQERKRKIEEERKRQEHLAKLERQRVDHLLGQAHSLHQAQQIRSYVSAVQEANNSTPNPMSDSELESWTQWALAQANRIDPVINGAFRVRPVESDIGC